MERHRSERLSEAIREELEEIIAYEMGDPRIDAEGVSEVLISHDARIAHVRLTLTGDARKQQETVDALNHARNYLRAELGRRLDVYRIPELHFEAAISADLGGRINTLLKRVKKGRPREESSETATGTGLPAGTSKPNEGATRTTDPSHPGKNQAPLAAEPGAAQPPDYRSPVQPDRNTSDTLAHPLHPPETSEKNKVP